MTARAARLGHMARPDIRSYEGIEMIQHHVRWPLAIAIGTLADVARISRPLRYIPVRGPLVSRGGRTMTQSRVLCRMICPWPRDRRRRYAAAGQPGICPPDSTVSGIVSRDSRLLVADFIPYEYVS